jgi:hypothetical protein
MEICNLLKWGWSPIEHRGFDVGQSIGSGIENFGKYSIRALSIGVAGVVTVVAANQLGLLRAGATAAAATGFGFTAVAGATGFGGLCYIINEGLKRM